MDKREKNSLRISNSAFASLQGTERCGRNPHTHAFSPSPKTEYPGEVWRGHCENKTKLEAQFIQNLSVDNRRIHVLFNG